MPVLHLTFMDQHGVVTDLFLDEWPVELPLMHDLLRERAGDVLTSVVVKETRAELRVEWQVMVRLGRTEQGFAEWLAGRATTEYSLNDTDDG